MLTFNKRSLLRWGGFACLATAAALVGCGKKEEPAKPAAPAATAAAPPSNSTATRPG